MYIDKHVYNFQAILNNSRHFMEEFCGARLPWDMLVVHHTIALHVIQVNVLRLVEMVCTFEATSYRKETDNIGYLRPFKIEVPRVNIRQTVIYTMGLEYMSVHWLLHAYYGYYLTFVQVEYTNIAAQLSFFDGPRKHYLMKNASLLQSNTTDNVTLDMQTVYFNSLVTLDVIWKSNYTHRQTLLAISFVRKLRKILKVNSTHVDFRVKNNKGSPVNTLYSMESKGGMFLSLSFLVRRFSGWGQGACRYGGYLLLRDKLFAQKRVLRHGPFCKIFASNDPLLSDNGLQNLIFGKERVILFFYAYSPLYTIDLDVIIRQTNCEGIINPMQICISKQNTEDVSKMSKLIVHGNNYMMTCSHKFNAGASGVVMRIILNGTCVSVQQIHIFRLSNHYQLHFIGNVDAEIQTKNPFVYNEACIKYYPDRVFLNLSLSNMEQQSVSLQKHNLHALFYKQIVSFHIYYTHGYNYHQKSYSVLLQKRHENNETCASLDSTYNKQLSIYGWSWMLAITNCCGVGRYKMQHDYVFKLNPYHLKSYYGMNKIKFYFSFFLVTSCNVSNDVSDRLSLCLSHYEAQSALFNIEDELHVVAHDISFAIYYHKKSSRNCATFKFIYHCQVLHLLAEAKIYENLRNLVLQVSYDYIQFFFQIYIYIYIYIYINIYNYNIYIYIYIYI